MSNETHCYVAICKKCSNPSGVVVDCQDEATAKDVAGFIKSGRTVNRMTVAAFRDMDWCRCDRLRRQKQLPMEYSWGRH